MSAKKPDKWLLVQWSSGDRGVVNLRGVVKPGEARVGAVVALARDGQQDTAIIIGSSSDRHLLEQQITPTLFGEDVNAAGPSMKQEDPGDFSASASSWEPSDEQVSSDDEEVEEKKMNMNRYARSYPNRRTSRILKPCHRADAINAIISKRNKRNHDGSIKRSEKSKSKTADKKFLPDSTRKNNSPAPNSAKSDTIAIDLREIMNMKQCFQELFKIIKEIKPTKKNNKSKCNGVAENKNIQPAVKDEKQVDELIDDGNESDASERSQSEESNRSDDNVLITNKYNVAGAAPKSVNNTQNNNATKAGHDEWIPIGSGQTLIHKDQFRKVKWKSYTVATRSLLLAVFPRRILATHSLTGKRSPAFQDKPAKMCLDPKIVTDVIIEITDRFKVKENLVRSIITTKCADECKMYKMRMKRKTTCLNNQENLPPAAAAENDVVNQTC